MQWVPENATEDIATHPLQALKPRPLPNVGDRLKQLTPEQLIELNDKIDEMRNPPGQ
ncbi:MAG: hypothetical protein H7Y00_14150 [Fimbriimonadaceae bacterium]|nr:hypothetical protein [Chitinophagales bacterium]